MATRWLIVLLILLILSLFTVSSASSAPVVRTVDDRFEVTVGYINEPAILGDTNGIRIQITENGEPVSGAADALWAQVEFFEAVHMFTLAETEPGVYTGVFIPMEAGDYTFHIGGVIDGVDIQLNFIVADGLSSVLPRADFEFPNTAFGSVVDRLAMPAAATAIIGAALILWRKRTA